MAHFTINFVVFVIKFLLSTILLVVFCGQKALLDYSDIPAFHPLLL